MTLELITYEVAARMLTVSTATVRRLVKAGRLRGIAITPRCHRVDAASLRAYLSLAEIIPTQPLYSPKKVVVRDAGASYSAASSLREALDNAKTLLRQRRLGVASSPPTLSTSSSGGRSAKR